MKNEALLDAEMECGKDDTIPDAFASEKCSRKSGR